MSQQHLNISEEDLLRLQLIKSLLPDDIWNILSSYKAEKKYCPDLITAKTFLLKYLKEVGLSDHHITASEYVMRLLVNYFGPGTPLNVIKYPKTEEFILSLRKQAPSGVKNYLRYSKAIFNRFQDWEYIQENPFVKIKLIKQQKKEIEFVTIEELNLILCHVDSVVLRDMFLTAFYTGLRRSELTNLRLADIELGIKTIHCGRSFKTKSRKGRKIPICKHLSEILVKYYPGDNIIDLSLPVFRKSSGEPYSGNYLGKILKQAVKKSGIKKNITPHSLRHSFASNLIINGKSIYKIKELLGHVSIATTEIYSHLRYDDLKEAISCFDN